MLVISPGERITVGEMTLHPWLNNGTAPNTVLQSPQQMLDQVCNIKISNWIRLTRLSTYPKSTFLKILIYKYDIPLTFHCFYNCEGVN